MHSGTQTSEAVTREITASDRELTTTIDIARENVRQDTPTRDRLWDVATWKTVSWSRRRRACFGRRPSPWHPNPASRAGGLGLHGADRRPLRALTPAFLG